MKYRDPIGAQKMKKSGKAAVVATTAAVGVGLAWRFFARRRSLPCPPWLDWLLENPYTEMIAGSDAILDRLDLQPGMRLLDVGSGPGRITLPAAERVGPEGLAFTLNFVKPASV